MNGGELLPFHLFSGFIFLFLIYQRMRSSRRLRQKPFLLLFGCQSTRSSNFVILLVLSFYYLALYSWIEEESERKREDSGREREERACEDF